MPRFSGGERSTGAGSTSLPLMSLYAGSSAGPAIREIGVFNTTTTPFGIRLARLGSTGTPGSGLTEASHDPNKAAPLCTLVGTHSGGPTVGDDLGYRATLGAAVGAGVIWTFGDAGLVIMKGSTNGIGVMPSTGAGQVVDAYFVWDE